MPLAAKKTNLSLQQREDFKMLKIRQICLPVVLSLFAAMPAQAKVTPIHEYNQAVVDDGSSSITITCETYNYYDSPVTNAICTKTL